MKKLFNKFLILMSSLTLLSGCNKTKISRFSVSFDETNPPESYLIPIDNERLTALMNGQADFLLYLGSPTCPNCTKVTPQFERYAKENKTLIYYYNSKNYTSDIGENFPYLFRGTPSFFVINRGSVLESYLGATKLDTYVKVSNIIKNYTEKTSIDFVYSLSLLDELISKDNTIIYVDLKNEKHVLDFNANLVINLRNAKKTLHFVDISNDFGITEEEFLTRYNLSKKKLRQKIS